MKRILELDASFAVLIARLDQIANGLKMRYVCPLSDTAQIAKQKYSGLYRIDVSTAGETGSVEDWIEQFRREWEHDAFKRSFTPNLKKKRIAQHKKLLEWMPLYLGKASNVASRVHQQINLPLEKTTFALKLNARPIMARRILRLHTLEVPVGNYDVIVPRLEAALRKRFHPLIGKQ